MDSFKITIAWEISRKHTQYTKRSQNKTTSTLSDKNDSYIYRNNLYIFTVMLEW
jgi:hypothetical protein